MKVLSPKEFSRLLKKGEIPPTILFMGEEVLLMDRALALIKDHLLGESWELNWTVLEGKGLPLEQLEEALSTVPFASPKRVVVVKEALELWKSWHKGHRERLLHALTQHPRHTLLVLQHVGKLEDKAFLGVLEDKGMVVDFTGTRGDLEKWVKKRLKSEGLPVEQEIVEWLLDVSQGKMAFLEAELEKFILWGKKGEEVEKIPSLWDVPYMVYSGDPKLLVHLETLMAERGYLYFFRILSSSIAKLAAVQQALEEGAISREKAISTACRFPKERRAMEKGLKRLSPEKSMELLELAMEAEVALKSGPLPPLKVLERLVTRIVEA